jgi:hypothetical protein
MLMRTFCCNCCAVLQGVVDKIIGKYIAEVCMLDSGDVLRIDQADPASACGTRLASAFTGNQLMLILFPRLLLVFLCCAAGCCGQSN